MKESVTIGLCFGLTSATITTLGLMIGLESGTGSRLVVIGGIITIAVADAFSDALGIHMSEESDNKPVKDVWIATATTWLAKFFFALTFLIPVLLVKNLATAMQIAVVYGLILLALLSVYLAKKQKESPIRVVFEHLIIAILVIILTHYVGQWVQATFY
jgi:VIT1/CCC1 family predicted Fe2+/Mn2+ transporter